MNMRQIPTECKEVVYRDSSAQLMLLQKNSLVYGFDILTKTAQGYDSDKGKSLGGYYDGGTAQLMLLQKDSSTYGFDILREGQLRLWF